MAFLLQSDADTAALRALILSADEAARQRADRLWRRAAPRRLPRPEPKR